MDKKFDIKDKTLSKEGKLKIESVDINTLNKNINNKDDLILLLPLINRCKANLKINLLLT